MQALTQQRRAATEAVYYTSVYNNIILIVIHSKLHNRLTRRDCVFKKTREIT